MGRYPQGEWVETLWAEASHIACNWHVASGAYLVSPDNKRLKTLRPTCRADFESRWGSICYAPPDDLLAVGARLKFAI
jgi:hypothetical protein